MLLGQVAKSWELLTSPRSLPTGWNEGEVAEAMQIFSFHRSVAAGVLALAPGPPGCKMSLFIAGEVEEALVVEALSMVHPQLVGQIDTAYGPAEGVEAAAMALKRFRPAITWAPAMLVTAMELGTPSPPAKSPLGQMRRVLPVGEDPGPEGLCDEVLLAEEPLAEKLIDCAAGFKRDAWQTEEPRESLRHFVGSMIATREVYVWLVEEEVGSMAAAGRELGEDGRGITMVYTPPGHRRLGYAGALVATIAAALAARGKRVCLNANAEGRHGAQGLYESIGFTNQGLMKQLKFSA